MIQVLGNWFRRYFSHPQAVLLVILLLVGFSIIFMMGSMLAPVFAAIVIAFLLEGSTAALETYFKAPRLLAVAIVFIGFMAMLLFAFLILFPLLSLQLTQFFKEVPGWLVQGQELLMQLPQRYPTFFSAEQVNSIIASIHEGLNVMGQAILAYSLTSITMLITFFVYLILVPVMVFFFLKDKTIIVSWFITFLPKEHTIAQRVWLEMNKQMGNYVRGKVYEIILIGAATYLAFILFKLNYASLLAALVGLSVIVPYIGAAVVTVPVILVAYFQFGWTSEFFWLVTVYLVLQGIDGNVLVPLLFSEAVNLHPVAIIVAVLAFGGLWGFWGVFFAIPLATLVKALLAAWPRIPEEPALAAD